MQNFFLTFYRAYSGDGYAFNVSTGTVVWEASASSCQATRLVHGNMSTSRGSLTVRSEGAESASYGFRTAALCGALTTYGADALKEVFFEFTFRILTNDDDLGVLNSTRVTRVGGRVGRCGSMPGGGG